MLPALAFAKLVPWLASALPDAPATMLEDEPGHYLGYAAAGDLDGDGFDDLVTGSFGLWKEEGLRVYPGGSAGLSSSATSRLLPYDGAESLAWIPVAGDVNGDGFADVLLAVDNEGVYLFRGSAAGVAERPDVILTAADDSYGLAVIAVDVDGDGYDDVVVGDDSPSRLMVFGGGPDGVSDTPTSSVHGSVLGESFLGTEIAAGDFDGDNRGDVLANGDAGAWICPGSADGLDVATCVLISEGHGSLPLVAGVGDLDGDCFDDFVVGGNSSLVYYGSPTVTAAGGTEAPQVIEGGARAHFAGDVNGDGYDDLLIGYRANGVPTALLYLGSPDGVSAVPNAQIGEIAATPDGQAPDTFVTSAGDVDSDGYGDVFASPISVFLGRHDPEIPSYPAPTCPDDPEPTDDGESGDAESTGSDTESTGSAAESSGGNELGLDTIDDGCACATDRRRHGGAGGVGIAWLMLLGLRRRRRDRE